MVETGAAPAERTPWYPWLVANWPRAGLFAAVLLAATLAALWSAETRLLVLAAALLPAYLIHQYEEHGHGRFVAHFNATLGRGRPVLTAASAFWINLLAVEVAFSVALLLARFVAPGWAFVPLCLTLVNAAIHLAVAARQHRPNPGFWTALLLFVPVGGYVAVELRRGIADPWRWAAIGLAIAVAVHAAIAAYALVRRRLLPRPAQRAD